MKHTATILICLISISVISQSIQFYKEDIKFEIKNNHFIVDGNYFFCNNDNTKAEKLIFFPAPPEKDYGIIDSISVYNLTKDTLCRILNKTSKGFYFRITLEPYGVAEYRVFYIHKLISAKAEYILESTRSWNKPLENAAYKLIISGGLELVSSSYEPDSVVSSSGCNTYHWQKKDFMPDKNFTFSFQENTE